MNLKRYFEKKENEKKRIYEYEDQDLKIILYDNKTTDYYFKTEKGLKKISEILFATQSNSIITDSKNEGEKFFQKAKERGTEGLMLKSLDAKYISGLRTGNMVKLKGIRDELDLVIIGAKHGKGKRKGTYSSFLVAVKDDINNKEDKYLIVGMVGSGFTEKGTELNLEELSKKLKPYKIKEENEITYFEPKIIVQVKYQEIQQSTKYNSGYALRFPVVSMIREDKPLEEINTLTEIKKIYENEFSNKLK